MSRELQRRYERARECMRLLWGIEDDLIGDETHNPKRKGSSDEDMLVAADALEEAGLTNDAAWLRRSYAQETVPGTEGPVINGSFVFIGVIWSRIPRTHPAIPVWKTKDGRNVPVFEMDDNHLGNAIRWCRKNGVRDWLKIVEEEYEHRFGCRPDDRVSMIPRRHEDLIDVLEDR